MRLLASSCLSLRLSFCPSILMEHLDSYRTDFPEIWYLSISWKSVKIQVLLKSDENNGTLHEDLCTFMIISRSILLRMRNVSDRSCTENQNSDFFRKSCRLWDNVEKYGTARQATDDNIIQRMRFTCWITKATDTHSEYVILIAFHGNNCYANAPQCYIIRTLLVLSFLILTQLDKRLGGLQKRSWRSVAAGNRTAFPRSSSLWPSHCTEKKPAEWVTLLTCIQQTTLRNLDKDIDYVFNVLHGLPQSLRTNTGICYLLSVSFVVT
jgi:hypothetical protein